MKTRIITFFLCALSSLIWAQTIPVEGYIYESGNRGYLDQVSIKVANKDEVYLKQVKSDKDGFFTFLAAKGSILFLNIDKSLYEPQNFKITVPADKEKHFVNVEMKRSPGYLFEVTIAAEKSLNDETSDGLKGYRIDVYNNTTGKEEFILEEYNQPIFQVPLIKENHYTVLIRKDGYMSKRIEAFVDIEGCILCFEGLGSVGPGVSETLSEQNTIGVLLANVSMTKAFKGKKMQVNDLYYDLGKWNLKSKSKTELKKLATLMKDNPRWIVELGSHTDSRGSNDNNFVLSQKRAKSAVDYLVIEKNIDRNRISAKGYGESNLLNDCDDSKSCSEEKHLINRRTEIQIVGIAKKMRYKSLAEIKRSENMDALLQEIQFGEQVMVPVYDAKQDSFLTAKKDSISNSLVDDVMVIEDEEFTIEDIEDVIFVDVEDDAKDDLEDDSNDISNVAVIEKSFEDKPAVDKPMDEIVKVEDLAVDIDKMSIEKKPRETKTKVEKKKVSKSTSIENKLSDLKYEKIISTPADKTYKETIPRTRSENKEKINQKIIKPNVIIKIVLMESADSISKSHSLYSTHENVKEIYHNGKFKYMFGEFKSMEEAKDFLNSSVKMVYPNAYVVKFN